MLGIGVRLGKIANWPMTKVSFFLRAQAPRSALCGHYPLLVRAAVHAWWWSFGAPKKGRHLFDFRFVSVLSFWCLTSRNALILLQGAIPAGIATHGFTFRFFNGLTFDLANWISGLPIPVPNMSFLPAFAAACFRSALRV
jgi:hypothetical protein